MEEVCSLTTNKCNELKEAAQTILNESPEKRLKIPFGMQELVLNLHCVYLTTYINNLHVYVIIYVIYVRLSVGIQPWKEKFTNAELLTIYNSHHKSDL